MLDVKTPLSKIHRTSRRVNKDTFLASPGLWAYVTTGNVLANIASTSTNQAQPKVLKIVMGNASSNQYESNDIEVGSISTLEGVFRATVDGSGYQVTDSSSTAFTASDYLQGTELTVAYKVTTVATSTYAFALAADIGKLRPALSGELVVARVENIDTTLNQLTFETVTPYPLRTS
jgi:hypothetical protein